MSTHHKFGVVRSRLASLKRIGQHFWNWPVPDIGFMLADVREQRQSGLNRTFKEENRYSLAYEESRLRREKGRHLSQFDALQSKEQRLKLGA